MPNGTLTPPSNNPSVALPAQGTLIDDRLHRTRRRVRSVDVATGLITLMVGMLAYLLAAAVIDHWVLTGGLGFWGRLALLLGLLAGAGRYCIRNVLPPLLNRINPVFAAHTIEQSSPSLKNSLVNLLLLRRQREQVSLPVFHAMESRAAADLAQVDVETAVDHTRLIRLGYLLVGILAVCCLYLIISPKNPLSSVGRVLWPWSSVAAPTRVTFEKIRPGDTNVFHGDFVTVSAEVRGLHPDEPVTLYYSTADGQSVDQKIPMTPPENGFAHQFECRVPAEELGLQQDVTYYLAAGDTTTQTFAIHVQTAPTIVVDRVEYNYPDYTGFAHRIVNREGDLRAIEGTQVTIHATANRNVASATIDLGCTGLRALAMKPSGDTASGRFTLRLSANDLNLPEFDGYQLRFRDDAGQLNPRPTRHQIEVIRDLPPEIQLLSPTEEEVAVAENGRLEIHLRAIDPDFALSKVVLRADRDGRMLRIPPLLDATHPNEFQATYVFEPAKATFEGDSLDPNARALKAGDRVRYWAEADDNKRPSPGHTTTAQQWIRIVAASDAQSGAESPGEENAADQRPAPGNDNTSTEDNRPSNEDTENPTESQPGEQSQPNEQSQPDEQSANDDNSSGEEGPAEEQQNEGPGEEDQPSGENQQEPGQGMTGDASENGESESGEGAQGEQQASDGAAGESQQPIDPDTQPGDAFEEILKHQREQQQQGDQSSGNQPSPNEQGGDPSDQRQSGENGNGQPNGGEPGGDSQNAGQPDSTQPDGNSPDGQGMPSENSSPREPTDGQDPNDPGTGEGRPTDEQPSDPQPGNDPADSRPDGASQDPGQGPQPDANQTGPDDPAGGNQPPENQPGEAGENPNDSQEQPPDSPNAQPDASDAQGETSGGRSGQGEEGGGQQSQRSGTGAAGSQTEADEGGSAGDQPGEGPTGSQGGDQVESRDPTGSSAADPGEGGSDGDGRPGETGTGEGQTGSGDGASGDNASPQDNPSDGQQPGSGSPSGSEGHNQTTPGPGGSSGERPANPSPPEAERPGGDAPNLEYSRRATDLALEHLRDQMDQEDSDLLDRLGWTREDARQFVEKWEEMKRAAGQEGQQGEAARQELDRAVESLGLSPRGTRLEGGQTTEDPLPGLREGGRFDPPSEWSEWFRAYTRGIAGGDQ